MPTYEYRCRACGHRFELFQKISDDPEEVCPSCGAPEAERLISSGGGIVFKGSGFYATDYRKDPPKAGGGSGSGEGGDGGSTSAGETSGSSDGSASKGGGEGKDA